MSVGCPKVFDELVALSFVLVSNRLPVMLIPHILQDAFPFKNNSIKEFLYPDIQTNINKSYKR